jgi:hypothetical protein
MDDKSRVSLLTGTGPGSSPHEPMALVVKNEDSKGFRYPPEFAISGSDDVDMELSEARYCAHLSYRE